MTQNAYLLLRRPFTQLQIRDLRLRDSVVVVAKDAKEEIENLLVGWWETTDFVL